MNDRIYQFLLGALVFASGIAALFFFRFWKKTHDRLFMSFGLAFALMGVNWLLLGLTPGDPREDLESVRPWFYAIRLLAFVTIIWAIWDKNRSAHATR